MSEFLDDECFRCRAENLPDCRAWLAGASDVDPKHVCLDALAWSVYHFAAQRIRGDTDMLQTWPLPLGARAIELWHEHQRALAEKSEREWQEWQAAGGCWAAMHRSLAETGRPFYWEPEVLAAKELPAWFTPLVAQPDAWLGLAGRRTTDAGTAWLLGLAEFVPMSSDFLNQVWKLAEPVVLVEAHTHTSKDLDALTAAVRPLLDWYTKTLLGKTLTVTIGRPKGSTTLFVSREDFRAAVKVTIEAIKAGRQPLSQRRVAEQLFPLNKDPEREFIRQRKHWGYPTWEDLKEDCES